MMIAVYAECRVTCLSYRKGVRQLEQNQPKNRKKRIVPAVIILILLIVGTVWWFLPVQILNGCKPEEITRIDVEGFPEAGTVTLDEEETRIIAENMYECGAKHAGISFTRMGYVYKLHFYKGEEAVASFSVITDDWGRNPVFFYRPEKGSYCLDYLNSLSEKYRKHG